MKNVLTRDPNSSKQQLMYLQCYIFLKVMENNNANLTVGA